MMIVFFVIYIMICLYNIRFAKEFNDTYLSKESTSSIKGVFIILVFFSHFNSYVFFDHLFDKVYLTIVRMFGQTMVTLFLFYSGYGIMESIKKKTSYVDSIPKNRIISTLLRFDCAVLIYLLLGMIIGSVYSIRQIIFSFIGWESVGNSNWYIFVILLLYLFTYVVFKYIKLENNIFRILLLTFAIIVCIGVCMIFQIKPVYWYDTALCYVLGMLWSVYRAIFEKFLNRNNVYWTITLLVAMTLFIVFLKIGGICVLLMNILFVIVVVVFTMRVSIQNSFLKKCGELLFEIYILQRVPMILFKYMGLNEYNIYLYFICCVAGTALLIKPFKLFTKKVLGLVLTK